MTKDITGFAFGPALLHCGRTNFEAEHVLQKLFAEFTLGCESEHAVALWEPIAASTPTQPDAVFELLQQLIYAEDRFSVPVFWQIWNMIAAALIGISDRDA